MKKFICLISAIIVGQLAFAYGVDYYETNTQYQDRQSQQNYQHYQNNNHQNTLGGYGSNSLNQNNGIQYGTHYQNTGMNIPSNNSNNHYGRSNNWNRY